MMSWNKNLLVEETFNYSNMYLGETRNKSMEVYNIDRRWEGKKKKGSRDRGWVATIIPMPSPLNENLMRKCIAQKREKLHSYVGLQYITKNLNKQSGTQLSTLTESLVKILKLESTAL